MLMYNTRNITAKYRGQVTNIIYQHRLRIAFKLLRLLKQQYRETAILHLHERIRILSSW